MPSVYSNTSGNSRNLRAGTGGFSLAVDDLFFPFFVKLVAVIVIEIIVASVVV